MRRFPYLRVAFAAALALICVLLSHRVKSQPTAIGPANPILCNLAAPLATGGTGLTQVIAAVTGQRINVCGWSITNTAASGTFQLAYGTGSNCGTGTTTLTPVLSVGSTAVTDHSVTAVISTPPSVALCINPSVSTIAGIIWASQQS